MFPLPVKPTTPLGDYRTLSSKSGVRVSPVCLGTMRLGEECPELGTCDEVTTFKILDHYWKSGGNWIDTANIYQGGQSEILLGKWMKQRGNRDDLIIATKFTGLIPNHKDNIRTNYAGNQIKSLTLSLKQSLTNLQTDYVDILFVHWYDGVTPVEEIMRELDRQVRDGRVHYLGISNTPAWLVTKANSCAEYHGWSKFCVYQGCWSVYNRDVERDILPMCEFEGMALQAYEVLCGGKVKEYIQPGNKDPLSAALKELAERKKATPEEIAIAYIRHKYVYAIPVLGCRNLEQLESSIEALKINLDEKDLARLEDRSNFDIGYPNRLLYESLGHEKYRSWWTAQNMPTSRIVGGINTPLPPTRLPYSNEDS